MYLAKVNNGAKQFASTVLNCLEIRDNDFMLIANHAICLTSSQTTRIKNRFS